MNSKNPYQLKRDKLAYVEEQNALDWLEEQSLQVEAIASNLEAQAKSLRSLDYKSSAFLSSSPVNLVTNLVMDSLLILKDMYKEGAPYTERNNPEVRFDYRVSGPLGNPAQTTFYPKVDEAWSPQLSALCIELTSFFSRSLKPSFNFQKAFHELLKKMLKFLPPGSLAQKSKYAEKKINKIKQLRVQKAQSAYFRRRRKNK